MKTLLCLAWALALAPLGWADDAKPELPAAEEALAKLWKSGDLFSRAKYAAVRDAFAADFEAEHGGKIEQAFGDKAAEIAEFFAKNPGVKEEFYTALHPKLDRPLKALEIFRALWDADAAAVAKYPNLVIAVCVVWDDPRTIYDYRQHQIRTHSTLPDSVMAMDAVACFKAHVERAKSLRGGEAVDRLEGLPWEFLTLVVDHRTPAEERDWAVKNYLPKRRMIGKIYPEVQYDMEMLRTQSRVCKLDGKPYTLESLKKFGGVCAMQADFAARVGKSLFVPAAYVGGESTSNGLHAWVMWVEVKGITKSQVEFSLESHGRYHEDLYYTGALRDPQTGERILDRDLERRLGAVGHDRVAKRLGDLAMRAYDRLKPALDWKPHQSIQFIDKVLTASPFEEDAWLALAQLAGEVEEAADKELVARHLAYLVRSFTKYPDFSWKIAPMLGAAYTSKAARAGMTEKLAALYESADRPDLACQARLAWADQAIELKQYSPAAVGLSRTIMKFPGEGRYVPKLVDKLVEACGEFPTGKKALLAFYSDFLKRVPTKRGSEPSAYAVRMYGKAIDFYKEQNQPKTAADLERQLAAIKGGK